MKKSNSLELRFPAYFPFHGKHLFLPVWLPLDLLVLLQIPKSPKTKYFFYFQTRTPF